MNNLGAVAATPHIPVGVLRHYFLPPSETFIYESLRSLDRYSARVFAIEQRTADKFPFPNVTALRSQPLGSLEALLYRVTTYSPRYFAWARENRLLHAHMGYTGVHGIAAARRFGLPLVTSFYGRDTTILGSYSRFLPSYWHFWAFARLLFGVGDRFLVLSADMKQRLAASGCPEHKIRIVPLGINLDRFRVDRRPRAGTKPQVLMVGREVEKKGFDDGLRACAAARDQGADIDVVVLGTNGPLRPALERQAAELGLRVSWPDPKSSVVEAMREADILLVPSRTAANGDKEGTPTVICEGSTAALPIVATRHAGIPEQVAHEATGLLAAERDVDTLGAHLARLARDAELRVALGRAGRDKMEREFSLAAHRDNLQAVYDELLGTGAAGTERRPTHSTSHGVRA